MNYDTQFVLFKNHIYSSDPEDPDDMFMGPDPLYYRMLSRHDEQAAELLHDDGNTSGKSYYDKKMVFYDPVGTRVWHECRRHNHENRPASFELALIRKIVVDEQYPAKVEYVRQFSRWTARRKTGLMLGEYTFSFGRYYLVRLLGEERYEPAIPELAEIVLHDQNVQMIQIAIDSLVSIGTDIAIQKFNSLLFTAKSAVTLRTLINSSKDIQSPQILSGLRHAFELEYYYYPENSEKSWVILHYECAPQQIILQAASKINTLEASEFLEYAIGHPYDFVEKTAYNKLQDWTRYMLNRISRGKDDGLGLHIAEIIKRYDFSVFSESYERLRKNSR